MQPVHFTKVPIATWLNKIAHLIFELPQCGIKQIFYAQIWRKQALHPWFFEHKVLAEPMADLGFFCVREGGLGFPPPRPGGHTGVSEVLGSFEKEGCLRWTFKNMIFLSLILYYYYQCCGCGSGSALIWNFLDPKLQIRIQQKVKD